jgi:acetyltransferase-like isoleucine patch superfamily enzyme
MPGSSDQPSVAIREVPAVFGRKEVRPDPVWEWEFAASLKEKHSREELHTLYARHIAGEGGFDAMMRRIIVRAMCKQAGHGLQVGPNVIFKHPETMEFGDAVFIGAQAMIQGRYDGTCKIGNHVWIGPQAYFDARAIELEDYVGWGPGAKVLGSAHTGNPVDAPIIATSLVIKPVRIGYGADVGMNAAILPGVHVGANAIVGAGAVVTQDVPEFAIVAGVPAKFLRSRRDS